jgi:hypothetical protein
MVKAAIKKKQTPFYQKLELKLRAKAVNCSIWSVVCMVLKLGRFGTKIKNTREDLKCGSGKGQTSFGPVLLKIIKMKRGINILRVIKIRKGNWSGHILRRNCLRNTVLEGR